MITISNMTHPFQDPLLFHSMLLNSSRIVQSRWRLRCPIQRDQIPSHHVEGLPMQSDPAFVIDWCNENHVLDTFASSLICTYHGVLLHSVTPHQADLERHLAELSL